jgi:uncharacterized membrane protein
MAEGRPVRSRWRDLDISERLFRVAVTLKGLDGAVQLLGGILLAFIPPSLLAGLAQTVITRDLLGSQEGALARHFELATHDFVAGSTRSFAIFYLILHGVIKLGLVAALLRKIRPAYPIGIVVLAAFVIYELYRATRTHSIALPIFAALDIVIIFFVFREYLQLRREQREEAATN